MSKTVGLPLAIASKNILNGNIDQPGIHIPTNPKIYKPILKELEKFGIRFNRREVDPETN
jgi:hypothetical protein